MCSLAIKTCYMNRKKFTYMYELGAAICLFSETTEIQTKMVCDMELGPRVI